MRDAVLAEYRKLTSTRMWWVLALVMAAYLAFIAVVMAGAFSAAPADGAAGTPQLTGLDAATAVYGLLNPIGYVFPLVVGSLMMTSEFRHRTVTESLLVQPSRSVFLLAKLAVAVPLGALYGVVGALALVATGGPVLALWGDGAFLTDPEVVRLLLLGVLVTVLWTLIGTSFGAIVTNQVAAIVVILAFTQLVEPVARIALGAVEGADVVARFLPGAAADAVMGSTFFSELGGGDTLSRPAGLAVFLAYVLLFAALGRVTTLRKDVA